MIVLSAHGKPEWVIWGLWIISLKQPAWFCSKVVLGTLPGRNVHWKADQGCPLALPYVTATVLQWVDNFYLYFIYYLSRGIHECPLFLLWYCFILGILKSIPPKYVYKYLILKNKSCKCSICSLMLLKRSVVHSKLIFSMIHNPQMVF